MSNGRRVVVYLMPAAILCAGGSADANILGQHHLRWWDDAQIGIIVTPQNVPPPTPLAIPLFDLDEWHIDQAQTTAWYNGMAVAGLPANPFNAMNRNGMTIGSVLPAIAGAEGFVYQITNLNYFNGNGPPPAQAPPFTFTTPPGGLGQNDLSGINIQDTHGALQTALPVGQFMFSTNLVVGGVLDLTPVSAGIPASQDWDFNAHTGPGNWEWDIDTTGIGASIPLPPIVFGYAMPGNWQDGINAGHVHSWNLPAGAAPIQVNVAFDQQGFSGPVPSPATMLLTSIGGAMAIARRRR